MQFKNNENGFIEAKSAPWLWTLLFGGLYFIFCGAWAHVLVWLVLAILLFGSMGPPATLLMAIVNVVYAIAAGGIIRNLYLRKGWVEVGAEQDESTTANIKAKYSIPEEKTCPFCAETIKYQAIICKHCGKEQPAQQAQPSGAGVELPPFSG